MAKTAPENNTKRVPPVKVIVYSVLAVLLLVVGLYVYQRIELFLIRDPRFALNGPDGYSDSPTLTVTGAKHASVRAIEAAFAEDSGRSVYLIPLRDRRLTVRGVDWVQEASVARLWPNRVLVRVSERKPVAFVTLDSKKFGLIDADGVILPPVQDRFELPVLAGVRATDPLSARRERVRRMLRLVDALGEDARKISEIDVADPENMIVTQPYEGRMLTLLLGDRDFPARYNNFRNHYEEIRRRLPGAAKLDLRLEDRITVVE